MNTPQLGGKIFNFPRSRAPEFSGASRGHLHSNAVTAYNPYFI